MSKTVLMIGAFDTKAREFAFLRKQILRQGCKVISMNTGTLGTTDLFKVDIEADKVARAGGGTLDGIRARRDRSAAVRLMTTGAPIMVARMHAKKKIGGIIGMGGTTGTEVVTSAMRALPVGFPKLCVTTLAPGDLTAFVRTKDILVMPSVVDLAGLNRVSQMILTRAAGAICGMVRAEPRKHKHAKPIVAASVYENTAECVRACVAALAAKNFEVLVFHAAGMSARTMESLESERVISAVLDITTSGSAAVVCDGEPDPVPDRLATPGHLGLPHLIVPGCADLVSFGAPATVPEKYRTGKRVLYEWSPSMTLMRTNAEENRRVGKALSDKANAAKGPVAFLIPLRGLSALGADGKPFNDPKADAALVESIKAHVKKTVPVVELDNNINDPEFAAKAVEMMLDLVAAAKTKR